MLIASIVCAAAVFYSHGASAQAILYDNMAPRPLTGPRPTNRRDKAAQQFLTGESNNVSTITLALQRVGSPEGLVRVEIWDDDGTGLPGNPVETFGSFEPNSLSSRPEFVTIEGMVSGLSPNTPYFVVLDHSDTSISLSNTYRHGTRESDEGTNGAQRLLVTEDRGSSWEFMQELILRCCGIDDVNYLQMSVTALEALLQAGDADQDFDFDQLDLVQVQVAGKYLTGQAATWGQGDWDGAPGGTVGNPPAGNGLFDQLDIIAALAAGTYLNGPYSAVQADGRVSDEQMSVIYTPATGELAVDAPPGVELTSINIDSASGIFTDFAAQNLGGSFDNDVDGNIFKAAFGSSFGSLSYGNVAQTGLTEEFVLGDLTVIGSLAGGGDLGNVDLVYVPEPTAVLLLSVGLAIALVHIRRVNR